MKRAYRKRGRWAHLYGIFPENALKPQVAGSPSRGGLVNSGVCGGQYEPEMIGCIRAASIPNRWAPRTKWIARRQVTDIDFKRVLRQFLRNGVK